MSWRIPHSERRAKTILLTVSCLLLIFIGPASSSQARAQNTPTASAQSSTGAHDGLPALFPRVEFATDSLCTLIRAATLNLNASYPSLVLSGVKVDVLGMEMSPDDLKFLKTYFDNQLRVTLSAERRFTVLPGPGSKILSIKSTDSTFQIKNTFTDSELKEYAEKHGAQGLVSASFLLTPRTLIAYLVFSNLQSHSVWGKEFRCDHVRSDHDLRAELREQTSLKKKTGLMEISLGVSVFAADASNGSSQSPTLSGIFVGIGPRFTEVATVFDAASLFIDTRIIFSRPVNSVTAVIAPGVGFEPFPVESIGPKFLMCELSSGVQITRNEFTWVYSGGLTMKVSRLFGISLTRDYLNGKSVAGDYQPFGAITTLRLNIVL